MESVQRLAPYLLLFQVLFPFVSGSLLIVRPLGSGRALRCGVAAVHLCLAVTSLALLGSVFLLPSAGAASAALQFTIPLLPGSHPLPLMRDLAWMLDLESAAFLSLIPWVALSAQIFTTEQEQTASQLAGNLFLTGSLSLFLVAGEVASLMCGAGFSVLLISSRLIRFGGVDKRTSASQFLTLQFIGGGLLAISLGMFAASAGLIRSAPQERPGSSTFNLMELGHLIQGSIASHPAAEQLWGESRVLPSCLMLCGLLIMAGGFPMQVWLSEVGASAALGERLWLVAWVKCVLLVGLRLLMALDPEALRSFGWCGLVISIPGALFVASLLLSQAYLPRIQSSGLAWTQQVALIAVFSATRDLQIWLVPLLICHLAALMLFTIGLSTISERYRSVEISSFQGLSSRTGWLLPVLLVPLLTLTLSPFALGLMEVWLVSATLQGSQQVFGSMLNLLFLLADLLAVAGLARILRQLCTGPLRLPEMSPGLRERTPLAAPVATLTFSVGQCLVLGAWSVLAILAAFSFPLLQALTLAIR